MEYKFEGNTKNGKDTYGITIRDKKSTFLRGEGEHLGEKEKEKLYEFVRKVYSYINCKIKLVAVPSKIGSCDIFLQDEGYQRRMQRFEEAAAVYQMRIHYRTADCISEKWNEGNYAYDSEGRAFYW